MTELHAWQALHNFDLLLRENAPAISALMEVSQQKRLERVFNSLLHNMHANAFAEEIEEMEEVRSH